MATIGDNISKNFQIPLDPQAQLSGQRQGGIQPAQIDTLPEFQTKGLQFIEGATRGYYEKIAKLKSFAHQMSSAGIDVTRPDVTDQRSMAGNNIYNKMLADIQNQGNALTNAQGFLEKAQGDPNQVLRRSSSEALVTPESFTDVGTTDTVSEANKLAKRSYDPREQADLNAQIGDVRNKLITELASLQEQGAPERNILQKINEINQLQEATLDRSKILDRVQRDKKSAGDKQIKQTIRPKEIFETQAGDTTHLDALMHADGTKVFEGVEHVPATGEIYLTGVDKGGNAITEVINLRSKDGGRKQIHETINKYSSDKIKFDQLEGYDPGIDPVEVPSEALPASEFHKLREKFESMVTNAPSLEGAEKAAADEYKEFLQKSAEDGNLIMPRNITYDGNKSTVDGLPIKKIKINTGFFKRGSNSYTIEFENGDGKIKSLELDPSKTKHAKILAEILDRNQKALPLEELGIQVDSDRVNLL